MMQAIKQAILDAITGDTAFNTACGATADDPRLYWYYNGDAVIDPEKGLHAYVTYAMTARPEQTQAVLSPSLTFVVWAKDLDVVEVVSARLVAVLTRREGLLVNGEILWGEVVNEADQYQQQPQFAGRNMVIRFGKLNLR